jgi:hypothetical protein
MFTNYNVYKLQYLQMYIYECMDSEFAQLFRHRNYNLRKLSGIISNAKRIIERYVRYNSFNKEIILNCIVFWNNILTCLIQFFISIQFINYSPKIYTIHLINNKETYEWVKS